MDLRSISSSSGCAGTARSPGTDLDLRLRAYQKIGFVPDSDEFAFGFLDPSLVLRGCHIVPAFAAGRTSSLLTVQPGEATAGHPAGETDDWENFYVIMCASFTS